MASHQETREIQRGLPLTLPSRCYLDPGGERLAPGHAQSLGLALPRHPQAALEIE